MANINPINESLQGIDDQTPRWSCGIELTLCNQSLSEVRREQFTQSFGSSPLCVIKKVSVSAVEVDRQHGITCVATDLVLEEPDLDTAFHTSIEKTVGGLVVVGLEPSNLFFRNCYWMEEIPRKTVAKVIGARGNEMTVLEMNGARYIKKVPTPPQGPNDVSWANVFEKTIMRIITAS